MDSRWSGQSSPMSELSNTKRLLRAFPGAQIIDRGPFPPLEWFERERAQERARELKRMKAAKKKQAKEMQRAGEREGTGDTL